MFIGTDKPSSGQLTKDNKSIVEEVKSSSEIAEPSQDSDQSETKSSELPRQKSTDKSLDQDLKATGKNINFFYIERGLTIKSLIIIICDILFI